MKSKFNIGQRVKLKVGPYGDYFSSNGVTVPGGAVGTVLMQRDWEGDCEVLFDFYPCPTSGDPAWFVPEDYLDPIYDGDSKSSWSECLWKPLNVPLSAK